MTNRTRRTLAALAITLSACVAAVPASADAPSSTKKRAEDARALEALTETPIVEDPFAAYDALLKKAVRGRFVDYDVVLRERAVLTKLRAHISRADVSRLSASGRLAFYTNAYNAIVLDEVLASGRPRSVLDVPGFFDKKTHTVAGESLTLNALEEKKLRASGDARVHFVVNCASDDCPPLAPFAYRGETWERDLEAQTKAYLTREGEVVFDDVKKTVTVVQLFEWYRGDFGGDDGARRFLARYLTSRAKTLMDPSVALAYRPYDWDLNQTR